MSEEIKVRLQNDHDMKLTLTPEDYESLRALRESPPWKLYRRVLMQTKMAYSDSLVQMEESNRMVKTCGIMAGLNAACNQIEVICNQYEKNIRQDLEKKERKEIPFVRG